MFIKIIYECSEFTGTDMTWIIYSECYCKHNVFIITMWYNKINNFEKKNCAWYKVLNLLTS